MRRIMLAVAVSVTVLAGIATSAADSAGTKTSATTATRATTHKAVFFAADGLRQDLVGHFASSGSHLPTMSEFLKKGTSAAGNGLLPVLASLEALITPSADQLLTTDALFDRGMLEIAPAQAPLIVLVWGVQRVVPVVVGSLSITEEVFDPQLRPIRAKVSLELKVLTTSDLPITHLGSTLYLGYRRTAESLAALVAGTDVRPLGLEHLP